MLTRRYFLLQSHIPLSKVEWRLQRGQGQQNYQQLRTSNSFQMSDWGTIREIIQNNDWGHPRSEKCLFTLSDGDGIQMMVRFQVQRQELQIEGHVLRPSDCSSNIHTPYLKSNYFVATVDADCGLYGRFSTFIQNNRVTKIQANFETQIHLSGNGLGHNSDEELMPEVDAFAVDYYVKTEKNISQKKKLLAIATDAMKQNWSNQAAYYMLPHIPLIIRVVGKITQVKVKVLMIISDRNTLQSLADLERLEINQSNYKKLKIVVRNILCLWRLKQTFLRDLQVLEQQISCRIIDR
ncbi:MAG: hypothetical protein EZS28_021376 [Streblomastix strix]|uniref:Uncharacterized protein n=1 Tax=Streblomastix strix TaxID=222440 RepID=A0A5J4VKH2_9EUKA|nr:MAG: hypothetical protein EZS28_021376 [Streblomastix strix]